MNGRAWKFEDIEPIEELERECFPGAPWNRRALADSLRSGGCLGSGLEEDGAQTP